MKLQLVCKYRVWHRSKFAKKKNQSSSLTLLTMDTTVWRNCRPTAHLNSLHLCGWVPFQRPAWPGKGVKRWGAYISASDHGPTPLQPRWCFLWEAAAIAAVSACALFSRLSTAVAWRSRQRRLLIDREDVSFDVQSSLLLTSFTHFSAPPTRRHTKGACFSQLFENVQYIRLLALDTLCWCVSIRIN